MTWKQILMKSKNSINSSWNCSGNANFRDKSIISAFQKIKFYNRNRTQLNYLVSIMSNTRNWSLDCKSRSNLLGASITQSRKTKQAHKPNKNSRSSLRYLTNTNSSLRNISNPSTITQSSIIHMKDFQIITLMFSICL